jgi:hypothetical protein
MGMNPDCGCERVTVSAVVDNGNGTVTIMFRSVTGHRVRHTLPESALTGDDIHALRHAIAADLKESAQL